MKANNRSSAVACGPKRIDSCASIVVREFPSEDVERTWCDSLSLFDYPTHYGSPEFFAEPALKGRKPFAILVLAGHSVVGVLPAVTEGRKIGSRRYLSLARNA